MEDSKIDSIVLSRELPPLACIKTQGVLGVHQVWGVRECMQAHGGGGLSQLETTPVGSQPCK